MAAIVASAQRLLSNSQYSEASEKPAPAPPSDSNAMGNVVSDDSALPAATSTTARKNATQRGRFERAAYRPDAKSSTRERDRWTLGLFRALSDLP